MDSCLDIIGLSSLALIKSTRTRQLAMNDACFRGGHQRLRSLNTESPTNLIVMLERSQQACSPFSKELDSDDDASTISTVTASSVSEGSFFEEDERRVSWAPTIVSEIRYRPYTSKAEKYHLFYDEFDYVDFKIDFATGRQRCTRRVSFSTLPEIRTFTPPLDVKHKLYYSERELQQFLDDFVLSLNQRFE
jgi:hypothetical protein